MEDGGFERISNKVQGLFDLHCSKVRTNGEVAMVSSVGPTEYSAILFQKLPLNFHNVALCPPQV